MGHWSLRAAEGREAISRFRGRGRLLRCFAPRNDLSIIRRGEGAAGRVIVDLPAGKRRDDPFIPLRPHIADEDHVVIQEGGIQPGEIPVILPGFDIDEHQGVAQAGRAGGGNIFAGDAVQAAPLDEARQDLEKDGRGEEGRKRGADDQQPPAAG